ncbi:hypothetical protein MTR67_048782 [Solanum verrucosum]|uniref:Uncharacterized protein n=1 Tax=Solanum verrucosum TaxID=315347 RepID=A0AAF0U9G4_SOLVR|nr:hypothetical protein MTR67_026762 [Solanum verrucosum]WMV41698.1 hypothetical protein MTR67_035083 [Solanum verrucosum]WMV55397.1 hypothetical protein MTR67_048782 [Solanum verrucosum]
MHLVVYLERKK